MKKSIIFGIITVLMTLNLEAQSIKFNNPVWDGDWSAPSVLLNPADNNYYSIAATDAETLSVLKSADMVNWEDSGIRPVGDEAYDKIREYGKYIRAPHIAVVNDKYVMYVSIYNDSDDCCIAALSSPSIDTPFRFESVIIDNNAKRINDLSDPFVVNDKGQIWMFFSTSNGIFRTRLTKDGFSLFRKNEKEHVAGIADAKSFSRRSVFEAPSICKHNGYWYLFATAGKEDDYTSKIVVGRCKVLTGDFVDDEGNSMVDGNAVTVFETRQRDSLYGVGNCSDIIKNARNEYFVLYNCHIGAWTKGNTSEGPSVLMLQRIYWDKDGWPIMKDAETEGGKIYLKK